MWSARAALASCDIEVGIRGKSASIDLVGRAGWAESRDGLRTAVAGKAPHAADAPEVVVVSKPLPKVVTDYFEFPGQTAAVSEVEVRPA